MEFKDKVIGKIAKNRSITAKQVADSLKISRAYTNLILRQLREDGVLLLIGKTNQARYVLASDVGAARNEQSKIQHIFLRLTPGGPDEDAIFKRIERETGIFIDVAENVQSIVHHGFTEMLNNAIEHSKSSRIEVDVRRTSTAITFVVRDFGIGIFNNVRDKFRLPGTIDAIQELLKGKATTAPEEHTGEGVFFTSKMADVFIIDSFEKRLTINNLLPDIFIIDRRSMKGTRVCFSINLKSERTTKGVFDVFTGSVDDGAAFDRTRITVKLFQFGRDLPSRSEAKRVTMNLENFKEIELDFTGVETIGQGFADQIFRVWKGRHPEIMIVATNANENVAFMVRRAGGEFGQNRLHI
ncbi:DUF4325 domain-containing protein [Candidatus Uhrbacteria bacterium]|nr:DUF4325 domain-containing protein [Candidatus Uhrbacteria bacterium]